MPCSRSMRMGPRVWSEWISRRCLAFRAQGGGDGFVGSDPRKSSILHGTAVESFEPLELGGPYKLGFLPCQRLSVDVHAAFCCHGACLPSSQAKVILRAVRTVVEIENAIVPLSYPSDVEPTSNRTAHTIAIHPGRVFNSPFVQVFCECPAVSSRPNFPSTARLNPLNKPARRSPVSARALVFTNLIHP